MLSTALPWKTKKINCNVLMKYLKIYSSYIHSPSYFIPHILLTSLLSLMSYPSMYLTIFLPIYCFKYIWVIFICIQSWWWSHVIISIDHIITVINCHPFIFVIFIVTIFSTYIIAESSIIGIQRLFSVLCQARKSLIIVSIVTSKWSVIQLEYLADPEITFQLKQGI